MPNKATLPDTFKIGDKEYKLSDSPEILAIIETVRTQEKNKLYSQIATKEAEVTDLANKLKAETGDKTVAANKLKEVEDALAVAKAEKVKIDADLQALKEAGEKAEKDKDKKDPANSLTADAVAKIVADALAKQKQEFDQVISGLQTTVTTKSVEDYKKELLAKHKGLIIPNLITGNSIAELDASVVSALETSKDYITVEHGKDKKRLTLRERDLAIEEERKAEELLKGSGGNPAGTPPKGANPPEKGNPDLTGANLIKNIKDMSPEEYAKHRSEILKEAKNLQYQAEDTK